MQDIIYDVAVSADGFISGKDGDVSAFPSDGPVVDDYAARMAGYAHAIMGRATYEFGYAYGMQPGQNPYPHMQTLVFSTRLSLPADSAVDLVGRDTLDRIVALKQSAQGPIYLCGGGAFAGALLAAGLIDRLRLKRAPILLGQGVPLFGAHTQAVPMRLVETRTYPGGVVFQEFQITP